MPFVAADSGERECDEAEIAFHRKRGRQSVNEGGNAQEGQFIAEAGHSVNRVHAKGGRTLRKDVFLPSKHLLSAFFKTLPSKNHQEILTGSF